MPGGAKMNQEMIGKFIAECRKEKQLTQIQLADKLGITNRAVSKWETGKSVPDVSIMLELCDELEISVNELLCGRHLDMEEEKMENNNNILKLPLAKEKMENLQIASEVLIFAGIIISTTFTGIVADSNIEKICTLLVGAFVWGYGIWMRIKLRKALKDIES